MFIPNFDNDQKLLQFSMIYSFKMSKHIISILLLWFGILCSLNLAETQRIQKHSWYRDYKPTGNLYIIYFNNENLILSISVFYFQNFLIIR